MQIAEHRDADAGEVVDERQQAIAGSTIGCGAHHGCRRIHDVGGDQVVGDQTSARRCGAARRSRSIGRSRCARARRARRRPAPACDVVSTVADDERARRSRSSSAAARAQHAGLRLAAVAVLPVALDRRRRDGADSSRSRRCGAPPACSRSSTTCVRLGDERLVEEPAADAGLVGDDDDGEAGAVQQADRVDRCTERTTRRSSRSR